MCKRNTAIGKHCKPTSYFVVKISRGLSSKENAQSVSTRQKNIYVYHRHVDQLIVLIQHKTTVDFRMFEKLSSVIQIKMEFMVVSNERDTNHSTTTVDLMILVVFNCSFELFTLSQQYVSYCMVRTCLSIFPIGLIIGRGRF